MTQPDRSDSAYRPLAEQSLVAYLATIPAVGEILGGAPADWSVREVGDGNLNLVFIVKGKRGGVAVKQALPYVRLVGESWPLPLSRAHYEHLALTEQARLAPGVPPRVHHYDAAMALIVMELLEPHIIMRRGMIAATVYPAFPMDIAQFMARTLYFTSDLALSAAEKKQRIAAFAGNFALCKITEDLIFTEPYIRAANNRWTSPELDDIAAAFREDLDLHVAISRLKLAFMRAPEAMIHGDLHTGSIMVTATETRVIDPEFAFYGPMGFDIGAVIANLLLNYFAQAGHESREGERDAYRAWVLQSVRDVWTLFRAEFLRLWRENPTGDAYPLALFAGPFGAARLEVERQVFLDRLYADMLGFAGAKMIRRILGLAHNLDLESIADPGRRAACERPALQLARELIVETARFTSIDHVTRRAQQS